LISNHQRLFQIGSRSSLRGSQSVSDLSNIHDTGYQLQERPSSSAAHSSRGNMLASKPLKKLSVDSSTSLQMGPTSASISTGTYDYKHIKIFFALRGGSGGGVIFLYL